MSSTCREGGSTGYPQLDRTAVLRAIAPPTRRRIVSALLDWPAPVDERALAASLAADERDEPMATVAASEEAAAAHAMLHQAHLPALVDADLVTWDQARGTVAPTDHPGYRDPMIRRLLRDRSEDVADALADRRRRTVLAALRAGAETRSTDELADEVIVRVTDASVTVSDVLVSLRHVHLPKLDDAGLIEYDRTAGTVTYRGHPAIDGPWFGWSARADTETSPRSPEDRTEHEGD